jgi:hypothetical protein
MGKLAPGNNFRFNREKNDCFRFLVRKKAILWGDLLIFIVFDGFIVYSLCPSIEMIAFNLGRINSISIREFGLITKGLMPVLAKGHTGTIWIASISGTMIVPPADNE